MASTVTRAQLRDRIRKRGDWPHSNYPTDSELNDCINDSLAALHDLIVLAEPGRFRKTATIAVSAGVSEYDLTTAAADFYRLLGVDVADGSAVTGYRTLHRYEWAERNDGYYSTHTITDTRYEVRGGKLLLHPPPVGAATLRLHYIGTGPELTADSQSTETVNRWSEWLIWDCVAKIAFKEGNLEDAAAAQAEREQVRHRISQGSELDHGAPKQVVDAYPGGRRRRLPPWWP